ncbi:PA14 domain-containing protein [Streptomyces uncialis]|uniref:PA14 domain-containing protein n=1 Tax=Streptomyces uncialis TaxID=1048205 RepID=UPI0037FF0D6E
MNPVRSTTAAAATAVVLATAGSLLTATAPAAAAPATCTSPVFKREFFPNTSFSGTPRRTDCDSAIDQNWKAGAPTRLMPKDNFGVRWTLTRDFGSGGPFSFQAGAQDGIRVYLDGARKIDLWRNVSSTRKKTVDVTVPRGKHTLRVDFVNWTGNADVSFAYKPRTSPGVDKVKPLMPKGSSVGYQGVTGRARATWAKNTEVDLAGYRVYRRLEGTSFGTVPVGITTSTSYIDGSLPLTGDTYLYEIRAYDKAGNESTGTPDQSVTTADRIPPARPGGLSAESRYEGMRLGWRTDPTATSYRVYRATGTSGAFTRIAQVDKGTYTDTTAAEGGTYAYVVTALDEWDNESVRSAQVSAQRGDYTAPPAVTGLKVTPTTYGFALKWNANPAPDTKTYVVHRGEPAGEEGGEQVCYGSAVEYLAAGTTSYDYTTLPDGDRVCFFVDVLDTAGNSSLRQTGTVEAVIATELDTAPAAPTPQGPPSRATVYGVAGVEGVEGVKGVEDDTAR